MQDVSCLEVRGFCWYLEGFTDTEPGREVPGLGVLKFLGGQEVQPRGMGRAGGCPSRFASGLLRGPCSISLDNWYPSP